MRVILFTREWTSSAVGSTSSCTVLLVSEVSGLQRKVCPRWRPAGGCTRGAPAPLVGGAAASMRDSVFCWRAACQRRGGNPPAPAFPRRGKRERGRSNSLLPQANFFTRPASGIPVVARRYAPWVAPRADCPAPTWLLHEGRTVPRLFHPATRTLAHYSPPGCSASDSFRFAGCGCPAQSCCLHSPARSCWIENTHARSFRRVRTKALPLPAAPTANRRLNSFRYSWRRNRLASSTVLILRSRNSCGSRPCQVR